MYKIQYTLPWIPILNEANSFSKMMMFGNILNLNVYIMWIYSCGMCAFYYPNIERSTPQLYAMYIHSLIYDKKWGNV